jgi:hypothetical protein
MATKKIVVKGSGQNLFKVSDYKGTFHIYKVSTGFLSDSKKEIGKTKNLVDAITLIRAYSGKEIDKIEDY